MKRIILIGIGVLVLLAAVAGFFFWRSIGQPLYEPGLLRSEENLRAPLTPPEQSGDESYWQVEADIQLHHFTVGEGRSVLLIHGGPGFPHREPWPGLDALTGEYTFHYYDQRGSGLSTRPIEAFDSSNYFANVTQLDQTLGLGAQLADIERIRQILGEDKLILIGHSFGGFLASLYAAEFPERVEALVLVAPADLLVMPQEDGGLFEAVRERLPEDMLPEYEAYLAEYFDFGDIFSKSEAELAALNVGFAEFYAAIAETPAAAGGEPGGWMVQAMYFSMGQRHDYRPALTEVTAPVLVIHGQGDLQSETASRSYAEAFPNAQFAVMAEATHFPFYEQPEQFAQLIGEFLSQTD